jgi:hypothetical protein
MQVFDESWPSGRIMRPDDFNWVLVSPLYSNVPLWARIACTQVFEMQQSQRKAGLWVAVALGDHVSWPPLIFSG